MSGCSSKKYIIEPNFFKVLLTETTYKADSTVQFHLNDWGSIILKSNSQSKFEDFWRGLMGLRFEQAGGLRAMWNKRGYTP